MKNIKIHKKKLKKVIRNELELKNTDYFITVNDRNSDLKTDVVFKIFNSFYNDKKNNQKLVYVKFGVRNKYFCAEVSDYLFTFEEFLNIYKRLSVNYLNDKEEEVIDFLNPTLKFLFFSDGNSDNLEIEFHFNDSINDYYTVSFSPNEKIAFYNLLEMQINELLEEK